MVRSVEYGLLIAMKYTSRLATNRLSINKQQLIDNVVRGSATGCARVAADNAKQLTLACFGIIIVFKHYLSVVTYHGELTKSLTLLYIICTKQKRVCCS